MTLFHPQKTTLHGYHEPIREGLRSSSPLPQPVPATKPKNGLSCRKSGEKVGGNTYHFYDVYHKPIINTSNEKSYDCFESMKRKGVRNLKGPTDVYRKPIVTSQDIGFWTDNAPLERLPWANTDRRFPRVFSDMSKFVARARKADLLFYFF